MSFTVKQLAELSGVSVRTLHYYDEIDLLKPAYYGENGYRYYDEKQLLVLQQILFYKELAFPLSDIQTVIRGDQFDEHKIDTLQSHRDRLVGDLDRVNTLIKNIDRTMSHLRGESMVNLAEIFDGFTEDKQEKHLRSLEVSSVGE